MQRASSCLVLFPVVLLCSGRLDVRPDRSMFFRYDDVTFSCSHPDSSAAAGPAGQWKVKRNTSTRLSDPCESGWGKVTDSSCTVEGLYTVDSALYWCETEWNHRSSVVNITVTARRVILSAPVHPVQHGAPFSLLCLYKEPTDGTHSISFEATFFKDGQFIGKWTPANMTVSRATLDNRGLYRCEHPTRGSSMEVPLTVADPVTTSWIDETTPPPTSAPPPEPVISLYRLLCFIFLFLLYTSILCIGFCVYCKWPRARAEAKQREADIL